MSSFVRSFSRLAAATALPRASPFSRAQRMNRAAIAVTRQYHAFKPTVSVWKGRKHAISDEDDEELEAELAELEREKREQEALEREESLASSSSASSSSSQSDATNSSVAFTELYDQILSHTLPKTPKHELPRHSALTRLALLVSTSEQARELPAVVAQWRLKQLPLDVDISYKLIRAACKSGSPETALTLLGDREKYGLTPSQEGIRRIVRGFVHKVGSVPEEDAEVEEGSDLKALDDAYRTLALIPYYELASDDSSIYASLIKGSLALGDKEEGLRRAEVTMDEYLLLDSERSDALIKRRAAQMVAAAKGLEEAYKEVGGKDDKVAKLSKSIAKWAKSV